MTPNLLVRDKLRLVASLAEQWRDEAENPANKPIPSTFGIMKGIGPFPCVEDFEEIRRHMVAGSLKAVTNQGSWR